MEISASAEELKAESVELSRVLRRLIALRTKLRMNLPEELAHGRKRLVETYPGNHSGSYADYELVIQLGQIVVERQEPITMGELSRILDVPLSTATRIVDWLEQSGQAERLPDPDDRRVVRVTLTESGWSYHRAANELISRHIQKWLQSFTPDERRSLLHLTQKLVGLIEEEVNPGRTDETIQSPD
jgi:DNA-binding MarR family transcriptional regulator